LSRVSKLCPGCARKVQKNGYVPFLISRSP
jgi:hypothetical protein